jgi:replicative DNA helicase
MTTPAQDDAARARYAIQSVLDGNPPNGTKPEDCGPWKDPVEAIFHAWDVGGTEKARSILPTLMKAAPGLDKLLSEGKPAPSTWGGILPFHSANLPAFPLDIFPPWLREYCAAVTETMQTPPDLAGMLALSILSTACARRIIVRAWNGWEEPVNVYTVTSLPPGSRKSPVFRAMLGPLIKFEHDLTDKAESDILRAEAEQDILKQRLEAAKRKAAKTEGEKASQLAFSEVDGLNGEMKDLVIPVRPKLIVDDVTPETIASILADQNGRLAVLSPEGDIFGIMAGRYTSGPPNIGVYLKAHAGDAIRVDRRSRSEYVKNPALTMGITTQPEVMRSFGSNAAFRGQGLLARFFYALPRSTVGRRAPETTPIPDHIRAGYFHRIMVLLENVYSGNSGNSGSNGTDYGNSDTDHDHYDSIYIYYVNINREAKEKLLAFMNYLEPQLGPYGALEYMADWAAKLAGSVLRVAGLLHIASHYSHNSQNWEIDGDTIDRALHLADYLLAHAQAAYAEIGADPAIDAAKMVLRWIEKTNARTFTKRDCYQGVKGTLKRADDLDPVLSLLVDHGYIREADVPERSGPGRKASAPYEVNPIVFDGSHNSHNSQNSSGARYEP